MFHSNKVMLSPCCKLTPQWPHNSNWSCKYCCFLFLSASLAVGRWEVVLAACCQSCYTNEIKLFGFLLVHQKSELRSEPLRAPSWWWFWRCPRCPLNLSRSNCWIIPIEVVCFWITILHGCSCMYPSHCIGDYCFLALTWGFTFWLLSWWNDSVPNSSTYCWWTQLAFLLFHSPFSPISLLESTP